MKTPIKLPSNIRYVRQRRANGATYILYETSRVFDSIKNRWGVKRVSIGKLCPEDGSKIYPNPNFFKYFNTIAFESQPPKDGRRSAVKSGVLSVGANIILDEIGMDTGVWPLLKQVIPNDLGNLAFDFICYQIIEESNIALHYESYACEHITHGKNMPVYSDATLSRLFTSITEEIADSAIFHWNQVNTALSTEVWIMYDSTNKNSQAGSIEFLEYGKAKVDQGQRIYNLAVAYDHANRRPLYYEIYNGSVPDVSQFGSMIEKLKRFGYTKVNFCLDRGYFSEANILSMDEAGYNFIIMIKGKKALVSDIVKEVSGSFELNHRFRIRTQPGNVLYGTTVVRKLFGKDRYVHIYHSKLKQLKEMRDIDRLVHKQEAELKRLENSLYKPDDFKEYTKYFKLQVSKDKGDKRFVYATLNYEAVNDELSMCGYFCILSSNISDANEAYIKYSSRDVSEKLFCMTKTFLGGHCARVHSTEGFIGKTLLEFFAIVMRARLYVLLKEEWEQQSQNRDEFCVTKAIRSLNMIKLKQITPATPYVLNQPLTRNQKDLFGCAGLSETMVKDRIMEYTDSLKKLYDETDDEQLPLLEQALLDSVYAEKIDNFLPLFNESKTPEGDSNRG